MNSSNAIKALCDDISLNTTSDEILIKTLSKCLNLLKNPDKYQKDIFLNLSDKGLNRLLTLMKHKTETIRKMSFLVLIDLLYNNEVLQNIFCEKYNFNPIGNVICLNWLPPVFKEKVTIDTNLIIELKKSSSHCNMKTKYWKWPNNPKYTDDIIPDPERYLVGFFYSSKINIPTKSDSSGTSYDIQKVIDLLEEGYEAAPLNLGNEHNNNNANAKQKGEGQKLKEEYKKNKIKNPSRSIDFKQMNNNERGMKNKK